MVKDSLGDRMKSYYESASQTKLTRRTPVIIRLDGCHFHTVTRGFKKPFDDVLVRTMQDTMKYLCENIQGCVLGYTQSDEITLVLQDYAKLETAAWFDYELQKVVSVSAAMATYAFNRYFADRVLDFELNSYDPKEPADEKALEAYKKVLKTGAYFDSRAFNIPKEEVTNCVYWRQKDAERNSVNSLAQSLFSHKSLQGLGLKDTLTKIEQEGGVVWGNLPTTYKRGSCCVHDVRYRLQDGQLVSDRSIIKYNGSYGTFLVDGGQCYFFKSPDHEGQTITGELLKVTEVAKWVVDNDIPQFREDGRDYIERLVNIGE